MKQAALNLNLSIKKTRKQVFVDQMDQVAPWTALELIAPYYPEGLKGRPPFCDLAKPQPLSRPAGRERGANSRI
jgi:hypothetical protein